MKNGIFLMKKEGEKYYRKAKKELTLKTKKEVLGGL